LWLKIGLDGQHLLKVSYIERFTESAQRWKCWYWVTDTHLNLTRNFLI